MSTNLGSGNYGEMLNALLDDLKALRVSIEYLEKFEVDKDPHGMAIARDSLALRSQQIALRIADNHQMTFPSLEIKELLASNKSSSKDLRQFLDYPMESLRKFALSEILRSSVSE